MRRPLRRTRWTPALAAGLAMVVPTLAAAQDADSAVAPDPTDPRPVELLTTDGVLLSGTYYAADQAGKETPIVVMLADEGESPAVFDRLALALQFAIGDDTQAPMSVLAIGLRGQGDSTRVRGPDGEVTDRRGAKLTPADAAAMVKLDMEAVRRFLVDKNDAGEVNLNRLAYLGVGLGALIATNGAAVDWEVPILDRGKQGRDVKALVLVSPPWRKLGLDILPALRQPGVRSQVAVLLTYGGDDRQATQNAERILRQFDDDPAPAEPAGDAEADDPDGEAPAAEAPPQRIVDVPGRSKLQGTAWLKQAGREGEQAIVEFLQRHLVEPEHAWTKRRLD